MNKPLIYKQMLMLVCFLVLTIGGYSQSGLYVPSKKQVKDIQKALQSADVFCLLLQYDGVSPEYQVADLDLLDSAYRLAFNPQNPKYYTMTIEAYCDNDEDLAQARVDNVYRYFAMRTNSLSIVRLAENKIHCSCRGDTVEMLRFEVPTSKLVYDCNIMPTSRRTFNGTIDLMNTVLITFRNDPEECVGLAGGCYVPQSDSVVYGKMSSLLLKRGSVYAVEQTKDVCPHGLTINIDEHLEYKPIIEKYSLVPHRKQIIVQVGYVVLSKKFPIDFDSCSLKQRDSIYLCIPATNEQIAAKVKFYAKVKTVRGMEYKALPTRKGPNKEELTLQAPLNITQFDTIYLGVRIQEKELGDYFYQVSNPVEASAFTVGVRHYVPYRIDKRGNYEMKKMFKRLFRIEEEGDKKSSKTDKKQNNPEEIIE